MAGKAIYAALLAVQQKLNVPKSRDNKFGGYKYRSAEDILAAAKPLCNDNGLLLLMQDEVVQVGERLYIKARASVVDIATGDEISTVAFAREDQSKKGMDVSQVTGATSSYARKYALNGLFAIDDTKDPDTNEYRQEQQERAKKGHPNEQQELSEKMERRALLNKLMSKAKAQGISKEVLRELCGGKGAADLTMDELTDIVNGFDDMAREYHGK